MIICLKTNQFRINSMNTKKLLPILNFFFIITSVFQFNTQIIESPTVNILNNYIRKDTLFIFDIDNTLVEPAESDYGSDQWFYSLVTQEKGKNKEEDINEIIKRTVPKYLEAQKNIKVKAVELEVVDIIKNIQSQKIPAMALTLRSNCLVNLTIDQLKSIGINFSDSQYGERILTIRFGDLPTIFYKGIMFCNNQNKGKVLQEFFVKLEYFPKTVVCIDDKIKPLKEIEEAMEDLGIKFIGIRYSYLDEKVRLYKEKNISNIQKS
jgi:hypothetical protein